MSFTEEGPAPVRQSGRGLDEDRPLPQPSRAPEDLRTPEGGGQQQVPVHQIPLHQGQEEDACSLGQVQIQGGSRILRIIDKIGLHLRPRENCKKIERHNIEDP